MIDLENKIERDKLIDDYFNKGYACDIREVYQAVVNTIADLEYANDEKNKEIERLNNIINELEKFIDEEYRYYNKRNYPTFGACMRALNRIKNKLQELKGDSSNE